MRSSAKTVWLHWFLDTPSCWLLLTRLGVACVCWACPRRPRAASSDRDPSSRTARVGRSRISRLLPSCAPANSARCRALDVKMAAELLDRLRDAAFALTSCLCAPSSTIKLNGRSFKIVKLLGEGGFRCARCSPPSLLWLPPAARGTASCSSETRADSAQLCLPGRGRVVGPAIRAQEDPLPARYRVAAPGDGGGVRLPPLPASEPHSLPRQCRRSGAGRQDRLVRHA